MFIFPILWAILFFKLPKLRVLNRYLLEPNPKPWDAFFGKKEACWIIVHMKNNIKIGGLFGKDSYASAFPEEEQLYIEEIWDIDDKGGFLKPQKCSNGLVILGKDITMVEFKKNEGE